MPPTKGRPRKKALQPAASEAATFLELLRSGPTENDILSILKVNRAPCDHLKNPCNKSGKPCKDNVVCFCHIVPPETSFRKKGLWQKEQAYLGSLGSDPVDQKREDEGKPAGLRNLGNTCYANAALQCLYSIPSLRNGIYQAESQVVAAHDLFRQLQSLFLAMQFGPRGGADTEALAKTLGLNHAVQQDGQEFLKLLLSRVEQFLGKSADAAARGLVSRLFRGGLSYITTCQRCGRDSAGSREVQDFYDLMPQVRGFSSLRESLAALLHVDLLTGDNRYRCEFCADKVDAARHVRLRSLPPYLCLALQRFYFDPRTADKAKALDKFSFPLQLDFSQVLETAAVQAAEAVAAEAGAVAASLAAGKGGAAGLAAAAAGAAAASTAAGAMAASLEVPQYPTGSPKYDLVAILIHKGSQASSGHYVAHIKDHASGQWWRFDDETAELIGPDPTAAFQQDHGAGAAAATAAAAAAAGGGGAAEPRKRAAAGNKGSEDPDYDDDDETKDMAENDDEAEEAELKRSASRGRGKKRAASGRGRSGPAPKRAAAAGRGGGGRGRGRRSRKDSTAADASDLDEEEQMQRAMAASMAEQGQEDAALAAALAESARSQGADAQDEEMKAALAASLADAAPGDAAQAVQLPGPPAGPTSPVKDEPVKDEPMEEAAPSLPQEGGEATAKATAGAQQPAAAEGAPAGAPAAPSELVSANAYMLVYRAVGFEEPPAVSECDQLPDALQHTVNVEAAAFLEQCEVYLRQREALKTQVESRRRAVRETLGVMAPVVPGAPVPPQQQQQEQQSVDREQPQQEQQEQRHEEAQAADTMAEPAVAPALEAGPSAAPAGTAGYWVSSAWLERWANDEAGPPPIDNGPILCTRHGCAASTLAAATTKAAATSSEADAVAGGAGGGEEAQAGAGSGARRAYLDPDKLKEAKLVSPGAWRRMQAAHGGGPTLAAGDVCRECLAGNLTAALLGSQADSMRARVTELLEEAAARDMQGNGDWEEAGDYGNEDDAAAARHYWVSRLWLQGWMKRSGLSVSTDKSPTADLCCPHGQLMSSTRTARRIAVPADVWRFLRDLWRQQKVQSAEEAARSTAAAAAAAVAAKPAASNGDGGDCMDLTQDDRGDAAATGAAAAADDDDDVQMVELPQRRSASAAPAAREGTADGEAPAPPSGAAATPVAVAIPTPEELDALCPELPVGGVLECRTCRVAAGQAAEAQADTKRQMDAERAALGGLAAEVVPTLDPGGRYFMVPSDWVREWQLYVRNIPRRSGASSGSGVAPAPGAGANAGQAAAAAAGPGRPGPLSDAMLRVLCPCHPDAPMLGVPLPRLVMKRNKLCQADPDQSALRLIPPDDWARLTRLYPIPGMAPPAAEGPAAAAGARRSARSGRRSDAAAPGRGASSDGDFDAMLVDGEAVQQPGPDGPSRALAAVQQGFRALVLPPPEADGGNGAAAGGGEPGPSTHERGRERDGDRSAFRDSVRELPPLPELFVDPPVCPQALAAHGQAVKEALLSYQEAEVMVEMVTAEDLEGAFRDTGNSERRSKRSRKGRTPVVVSNTTTLEQLKLQLFQNLSVHPKNQTLYVRGNDGAPRQLLGDDLSLAQHEVPPGAEIRLVRLTLVDDDADLAELLGDGGGGRGKRRQVEEGFKNTALHGDLPVRRAVEEGQGGGGADPRDGEGACAGGSGSGGAKPSISVLSDTVQSDG